LKKRIFSPYRICPIGAHIDHQGGAVLGRTIGIGTTLEYEALDSDEIRIASAQCGETSFRIRELDRMHWARYAQAAARLLPGFKRGLNARLSGALIGAGLSSSASVGLAYILALADVNEIDLAKKQLVQLEFQMEHDILNLQIGLLDPMTIVNGRKDALLFMDMLTASVTPIFDSPSSDSAWIIAYSGVSRELTKSGFNLRVHECQRAAEALKDGAKILSDIPRALFEDKKASLPDNLRKRAEHFFAEVDRVHQSARAWKESDLESFGTLMNRSCQSSIDNYEVGSDVLVELHELVSGTTGIYGSRFSGGGYGGCVVALANRDAADDVAAEIAAKFSASHPELPAQVFVPEMGDGIIALDAAEDLKVQL
jgi:Galactokinase